MSKLPAFQFYPGDWRKDPNLSRCSKAAKGFWMDCIAVLWDCSDRGRFCDSGGKPWSNDEIAYTIGGDIQENLRLLQELLTKEVAYRDGAGVVFSKRMVEDEIKRKNYSKGNQNKHKSSANLEQIAGKSSEDEGEVETAVEVKEELLNSAINEIWQLYPRKVSKRQGLAAIRGAIERESKNLELPGAIDYLKIQTQKFFQAVSPYIKDEFMLGKCPHGATWFNDSRYDHSLAEWTANFKTNFGPKTLGGENGRTRASQRQKSSFDAIRAAVDRANERATGNRNGSHEGGLHQSGPAGGNPGRDDAGLESPDSGVRRKDVQASVIESQATLQILPNHGRDKGVLRSGVERIQAPLGSG